MGWLTDLITGGANDIIDSAFSGIDKLATSKEELAEIELKKQELKLKARQQALDAENKYFEDTKSAREMQIETKSNVPGSLTIIFTVAFFALIAFILLLLFNKLEVNVPNYVIALISSIFGSVATIMTQIIGFWFGSSKGGEDQNNKMVNAFSRATIERGKNKE